MALSEIAAGIEVTAEQRERGVATADETGTPLADRLEDFDERLPCSPDPAATLLEAYVEGASVGRAAAVASVPETTAAKTLFLLGEPIDPLTPTAARVVDDFLAGELPRTEARTLSGLGETEFALAVYVRTHDPIDGAETAVAETASVPDDEDPLADARDGLDGLI